MIKVIKKGDFITPPINRNILTDCSGEFFLVYVLTFLIILDVAQPIHHKPPTSVCEPRTPDGILRMPYVTIAQEELSGSLIRVVKGLLCHHAPAIPRDELKFNVIQIDQMKLNEVLDPLLTDLRLYGAKGDGAFRYWAGFIPEDKRGGIWVLMFYDSAAFAVFHEPGGRG